MTRDTPRCPIFGPKIWEFSGGPPGPPTPDLIIPRNFGRSNLNYHVIKFFPALPVWPKMARKVPDLGGSSPHNFAPRGAKIFLGVPDYGNSDWLNLFANLICGDLTNRLCRSLAYPPLHKISILQKTPIYNLISFAAKKH